MQLPPSTLLKQKQYQVETILGQGSFGITYRGIDLKNSRYVAIKENWPDSAVRQGTTVVWPHFTTPKQQQDLLWKFKSEAEYLSKCVHPNIVRVYDWFEENNTAYTVMDFIPGKPLSKIFEEEGSLPQIRVKRYCIQIAYALKVIHFNNLLHRDIKPDNIIIDQQDRAILIDFGATREFIAGRTGKMTAILTPGYAPIEQYRFNSKPGPGTDIYALCASLYELLTGQHPPESTARYPSDILTPPRLLVPQINPQFEQVILTGMARELKDRFQTADELILALQPVAAGTARLVCVQAGSPTAKFFLDGSKAIIGRTGHSDSDTVTVNLDLDGFPGADTVSRQHAEIYREGNQWKVKDLGSANGVFIKPAGQTRFKAKITNIEALNSGDEIAFGKVRFIFDNF